MRKQYLIVGLLMLSAVAFGQKKEIKKAEKALKTGNTSEAITYLEQAEGLLGSVDASQKAQFYTVKGEAYLADAGTSNFDKMKTSAAAFSKAIELSPSGKFADRATIGMQNLRVVLVNSAIKDQNTKNFSVASQKLYTSYTISKKDTSDLYFASGNAVNAKEYATAISYYEQLLDLGYTGIATELVATNKETGEVEAFTGKVERDLRIKGGTHIKPEKRVTSSKRGDILRNMTLIYINNGDTEKATALMKTARAENPNDMDLLRAEADMMYKIGNIEKYNELMSEMVASDPNNPEVYFNLGVASSQLKNDAKAKEYYKKAIELDKDYASAQINLAALILEGETAIVEEMNGLGTSSADNKRYDELKAKRTQLYMDAVPYLETAKKLRPDNIELVRTLMNIYSQLGEDGKFKTMKDKLQQMEGGQ